MNRLFILLLLLKFNILLAGDFSISRIVVSPVVPNYIYPDEANFRSPPLPEDYPLFSLVETQFAVLGAPAIIDSITNSGLVFLMLFLFVIGLNSGKHNNS